MKSKLKIFNDFAEGILPHEASFLLKENKIRDEEKESILKKVCKNAVRIETLESFDEDIDKRKYAYIKKWINTKLGTVDVDAHLEYLSFTEKQIITDTITPKEEQELLSHISTYNNTSFYFQKFYELLKEFQDYLLIRFRYQDCKFTESFLEENKKHYEESIKVKEQLFYATKDLTQEYTSGTLNTMHWEQQLLSYLYSEELDGKNKYNAFIRLVFLYFNYKEYQKAMKVFDYVDECFSDGKMYSKRVLFNYYANRVILHSNLNDAEKAEYYAHLSVKQENSDKLFYLNNLIAILLKRDKNKQALNILTENYALFKKSNNNHQKLGFATHYIRTLIRNKRLKIAETFAENFLFNNKQHVFEHRWRHFFSNYLMLLTIIEKHVEVVKMVKKYDLLEREAEVMAKEDFIPKIHWYYFLAMYMNGSISEEKLMEDLLDTTSSFKFTNKGKGDLFAFIDKLSFTLPEIFSQIKSHLKNQLISS
ncbi:hypothetical protein BC962_0887 [Gillisia mitskevichiae]|uniref:Tetratricopeptide repeat protein n=1 Tax=Gillisia mitskevichiae TaxID=270921 RepID=A0A495PZG6_9FLAO|nr:hypothetical protein [Gillisia mitskevichiae]RKS55913.1 hypothetical protein BC962_0887 [Gillisia mitskevichiae]